MPPANINKVVSSLCPICFNVISARIFQEGSEIFMEKRCEAHGEFRDLYWSDASLYNKFNRYWSAGRGVGSSLQDGGNSSSSSKGCPFDCGICSNHLTGTLLANIDLTSRCNMACPICFADAGGRVYEPTREQVQAMMSVLRSERPVPCPAVQFSGGEPTVRDDLPSIVAMAKLMGFSQIQLATNGLRLAASVDLCRSLERSGLNTVYLQFDGVTPEPYQTVRGGDFLPIKLRAIENFRRAGQTSVVLVPTLAKGVNDSQVGDIVRFASKNLDVVKGINFQPVAFAGRVDPQERKAKRITIPDFLSMLEEQTENEITRDDFYPVPFVVPISQLIAAESGQPQPTFSVHPCCGAATYIYRFNGHMIPINRFIDVEGLMERIALEVESFNGSKSSLNKLKMKGKILKEIPKFVDEASVPGDLNVTRMLLKVFTSGTRESVREFHNRTLFLGAMHFQDAYNMDLERLQRCGVHYATPDGRLIPFCAYNVLHRKAVEDRFSV
jgi:7,8-dihydro-6-hydroxymethylpterin dimethyltransferase